MEPGPLMIPFPPLISISQGGPEGHRFIWDCLPTLIRRAPNLGNFFSDGAHGGGGGTCTIRFNLSSIKNVYCADPTRAWNIWKPLTKAFVVGDRIIICGKGVGWMVGIIEGFWRALPLQWTKLISNLFSVAKIVISSPFSWIWEFRHPSFRTERVDSTVHQAQNRQDSDTQAGPH